MVLKTFNLDQETYEEYSKHCKKHGISMSKRVESFIQGELEKINEPKPNISRNKNITSEPEFKTDMEHRMSKYC